MRGMDRFTNVDEVMEDPLITEIDAVLPQTQCRRCGFPGCRPYAAAIVEGRAQIDRCPPGGEDGLRRIAALLGMSPVPLNTAHKQYVPKEAAFIDEQTCIGCTLCIQACPVDAIVGAAKQVHTVIGVECTGCELCVEPCPVDCISMIPGRKDSTSRTQEEKKTKAADRARTRYQFRVQRLERDKQRQTLKHLAEKDGMTAVTWAPSGERKNVAIQTAIARARAARTRHDIDVRQLSPLPGES